MARTEFLQIRLTRQTIPIGERGDENSEMRPPVLAEMHAHVLTQFGRLIPCCVDDDVRTILDIRQHFALVPDAVGHRPIGRQRMTAPAVASTNPAVMVVPGMTKIANTG